MAFTCKMSLTVNDHSSWENARARDTTGIGYISYLVESENSNEVDIICYHRYMSIHKDEVDLLHQSRIRNSRSINCATWN